MCEAMNQLFVFFGIIAVAVANICSESALPPWSKTYVVKGAISYPSSEITTNFQVWYDGTTSGSEKSRMDYFGGQTKTFEFASWPDNKGLLAQIIPVTTEQFKNKMICETLKGEHPGDTVVQNVLPSLDGLKCAGKGSLNGIEGEKWTNTLIVDEVAHEGIMWVKWETNQKAGGKIAIPIAYESISYDADRGTHYDHIIVHYYNYRPVVPAKSIWAIPKSCEETMSSEKFAASHPIKEIVHKDYRHINRAFSEFLITHNRQYNNISEHRLRKNIFKRNHQFVHAHNRANLGYTLALNHLADRTDEELKALRGIIPAEGYNGGSVFPYSEDDLKAAPLPLNFDWRLYGAVTPVKNQISCGSCWSFGTTGTLEGAYFMKTGKLITLSEQALMDCSWGFGNKACGGGLATNSYKWIQKHGGLPVEEEYGPYQGLAGFCHSDKVKLVAPITGWVNVTTHNERALKLAIFKHGPIAISINSSLKTFNFYSNGVYYDPKCKGTEKDLDHAVLVVGYGWINHKKYWLVKNSLGNAWGNDGYILMEIKNNNCGVMTRPTYVTM